MNKQILKQIKGLRFGDLIEVEWWDHSKREIRLKKMSNKEVEEVKNILKALCRRERGYGRRLLKTKSVFPKPEETRKVIEEAGLEKLAKTLRILSFLGQTKVYLIWKRCQTYLRSKAK